MKVRHLVLDRDGVLNAEPPGGGWVLDPADWAWIPGSLDALARLHRAGIRLSVVTNQSAVGRGLATAAQVEAVLAEMRAQAARAGVHFADVRYCPHRPEHGCACRKPAPGMVLDAIRAAGIPAEATALVGDDARDLRAGLAAGVRAILVRTGKGRLTEAAWRGPAIPVHDDLAAAATALLAGR